MSILGFVLSAMVKTAFLAGVLMVAAGSSARAQRHSFGAAPPTAPPAVPLHAGAAPTAAPAASPALHQTFATSSAHDAVLAGAGLGPVGPVSMGMGAIQFAPASASVPAPQTLTRQLAAEDERTRLGALASLGVPAQYLIHGRVPTPHSVQLDMVQLSSSDELDALLTVELDQHVVNAVLVPESMGTWKRVATLSFASSFSAGTTTPANFVRPLRSWLEPGRYRAVYHATVDSPGGDFTENEADLRIVNGHAAVVISFVSGARQCDATGQLRPPHQTCEIIQRWLEPDPLDPTHHFTLITGVGHISAHEAEDPLSRSRNYRFTRLRSFACQPFVFSDTAMHFVPSSNSAACAAHEGAGTAPHPDHNGGEHPQAEHAAAAAEHGTQEHSVSEHP